MYRCVKCGRRWVSAVDPAARKARQCGRCWAEKDDNDAYAASAAATSAHVKLRPSLTGGYGVVGTARFRPGDKVLLPDGRTDRVRNVFFTTEGKPAAVLTDNDVDWLPLASLRPASSPPKANHLEAAKVMRCPHCGAGPGRQTPLYDCSHGKPVATGFANCEVCRRRYRYDR